MSRNDCLASTGDYRVLDEIEDPDGVYARVTCRTSSGGEKLYSFRFYRSFFKDGKHHETNWMLPRHLSAVTRLATKVQDAINRHRDEEVTV